MALTSNNNIKVKLHLNLKAIVCGRVCSVNPYEIRFKPRNPQLISICYLFYFVFFGQCIREKASWHNIYVYDDSFCCTLWNIKAPNPAFKLFQKQSSSRLSGLQVQHFGKVMVTVKYFIGAVEVNGTIKTGSEQTIKWEQK